MNDPLGCFHPSFFEHMLGCIELDTGKGGNNDLESNMSSVNVGDSSKAYEMELCGQNTVSEG